MNSDYNLAIFEISFGKETMLTGYLESITTLRNYAGPITLKVRAKMQLSIPIYSLSTANNQFDPIQGKQIWQFGGKFSLPKLLFQTLPLAAGMAPRMPQSAADDSKRSRPTSSPLKLSLTPSPCARIIPQCPETIQEPGIVLELFWRGWNFIFAGW